MGFNDLYDNNAGLVLGLGLSLEQPCNNNNSMKASSKHPCCNNDRKPSLTLSLYDDGDDDHHLHQKVAKEFVVAGDISRLKNKVLHQDQISGDLSAASSLSNASVVKREREVAVGGDDMEIEKVSSRLVAAGDGDGYGDGESNGRKKLRLTKAQSALLEESFKHHSTLNPKQKQDLARELKLRPRQVEVWFQNRRARTKVKQTEVDYEFLKKCCETLTEENRRLQKELKELKALKLAQPSPAPPLYMQFPAAALTVCPSCEGGGGGGAAKGSFSLDLKPPQLYNPSAC